MSDAFFAWKTQISHKFLCLSSNRRRLPSTDNENAITVIAWLRYSYGLSTTMSWKRCANEQLATGIRSNRSFGSSFETQCGAIEMTLCASQASCAQPATNKVRIAQSHSAKTVVDEFRPRARRQRAPQVFFARTRFHCKHVAVEERRRYFGALKLVAPAYRSGRRSRYDARAIDTAGAYSSHTMPCRLATARSAAAAVLENNAA